MHADNQRALAVQDKSLDVDVRHLGRELRSYNYIAATAKADQLAAARAAVARAASKALAAGGVAGLLELRAFQMVQFIAQLRKWEQNGVVSRELQELGGDILAVLQRNRWCRSNRSLILDNSTLRAFYKQRWNVLVAATGKSFALSNEEERVRFDFLLRHPFERRRLERSGQQLPAVRERMLLRKRLQSIDKLQRHAPDYPGHIARGVSYYRAGMWPNAAAEFQKHLESRPDGPYRLRAQNHLQAALQRSKASGF